MTTGNSSATPSGCQHLPDHQLRKEPLVLCEFLKPSLLHDATAGKDIDPRGVTDRAEAMRNDDTGHT